MYVYHCKLKSWRKLFNVSQKKLAEEVGCSQNTISNIECGIYQPSIKLAMRISQYFDFTIEDLFFIKIKGDNSYDSDSNKN